MRRPPRVIARALAEYVDGINVSLSVIPTTGLLAGTKNSASTIGGGTRAVSSTSATSMSWAASNAAMAAGWPYKYKASPLRTSVST